MVCAALVMGCKNPSQNENTTLKSLPGLDTVRVSVAIERLDERFFAAKSPTELLTLLAAHPAFARRYFPENQYGPQKPLADSLFRLFQNPALQNFYRQVPASFGDLSAFRQQLTTAFRHLKAYDPAFRVPKVYTVFTGFFGSDLFVSDSLAVIGLDYFLGPKSQFRPAVYTYQLWRYTPEALVPQLVYVLSEKYTRGNPADQTLLADMIGYGKALYFTENMVPGTPDSLLIGYTPRQLTETAAAQDLVWAHLLDNKLLFEKNPARKTKYIGDRPGTPEIGPRAPGGIGRWVGWQIIRHYARNNPGLSLKDIMQQTDNQKILSESKYRGEPD